VDLTRRPLPFTGAGRVRLRALVAGGFFVVVPEGLRALLRIVAKAPGADAFDVMDRAAAALPAACGPFLDAPAAVLPAQRALLLLGARPARADRAVDALAEGLRRVDDQRSMEGDPVDAGPGFSRLLESALEAGLVRAVARIEADAVDEDARRAAFVLEDVARELSALDDLGHALGRSTTAAAGAAATRALAKLFADAGAADLPWDAWLRRRGVRPEVAALLPLAERIVLVDDDAVAAARAAGVLVPYALWVVAGRLARGAPLDGADRPALDALLATAGLHPVDVYARAASWQDRDG